MEQKSLRETFGFLLSPARFNECIEEQGSHYREAYFRSPILVLRIAEQDEITPKGMSVTCLAFLVDPKNHNRWCMFEKAVEALLKRKVEGSESLPELQRNVCDHIDSILDLMSRGSKPPFEDFSQFT